MMKTRIAIALALMLTLSMGATAAKKKVVTANKAGTFETGKGTFLLNGQPFIVKAAELHYPRIPRPYWEHRIRMCKAMGMNTVCLYIFWNIHEQREGQFDFTGQNDVAEFCRLCQKNGMYVIVRPGPYVCAEWEMGGLPWWLLKKRDIRLREQDPYFMECVRRFEAKVGEQLASLTIQRGGPIIMVQVENEYGAYGQNKPYVAAIRDIVRQSGFDKVMLFQCDWATNFEQNGLDDLTWTMNFGTGANIAEQFRRLGELRPDAPKMCSEFWSGWFDKWGARHETRPAADMVAGIGEMLSQGISFSLYMAHGGTSFGHWAGANSPGFAPDVTSYDYDAPINEQGLPTEKFWLLREEMQKHSRERLPDMPKAPMPTIDIPTIQLSEFAPLSYGIAKTEMQRDICSMEQLDMGWGSMVYRKQLPATEQPSTLEIAEPHDYVQVFLGDQRIGVIDRIKNERTIALPAMPDGGVLTLLVEAMGRINFGRAIADRKGITDRVVLHTVMDDNEVSINLKNWNTMLLPDDYSTAAVALNRWKTLPLQHTLLSNTRAGYYCGYFKLQRVGDTFLNMEAFGKGQVYVNGHAIGRYWNIGPQQTLYVPGCWLKQGENEVIVLDVIGPTGEPTVFGQQHHELDKLHIERNAQQQTLNLNGYTLAAKGQFAAGNGWQTIALQQPVTARRVALKALSTHDGQQQASIAELYLLDTNGQRLSREGWTVSAVSSEDTATGNKTGDKVFDLQESTYWSSAADATLPHTLIIDLGGQQTISALQYLPRAEQGAPQSIKDFELSVQ